MYANIIRQTEDGLVDIFFNSLVLPTLSTSQSFAEDKIYNSPATNKLNSNSSKLIFEPVYSNCSLDCGHICSIKLISQ
jgi:hypothetical protein